jgi:hypothetical protein
LFSKPWKMAFVPVLERLRPASKSKVSGSRPNTRVQISNTQYLRTYAFEEGYLFGTFVCLVMFHDKNEVMVQPVTPKERGGG